jgi:hypothetical protein
MVTSGALKAMPSNRRRRLSCESDWTATARADHHNPRRPVRGRPPAHPQRAVILAGPARRGIVPRLPPAPDRPVQLDRPARRPPHSEGRRPAGHAAAGAGADGPPAARLEASTTAICAATVTAWALKAIPGTSPTPASSCA